MKKKGTILHHYRTEDQDFCMLAQIWLKEEDCNSVNRLKKGGNWFRIIPREDKISVSTGLIYNDKYNPSLVIMIDSGRLK